MEFVKAGWDELLKQQEEWKRERAALTQRAEAAEAALALATNSMPGKTTGVWGPLDKWTELQAQLAAVPEHDIIMIYNACPLNTATQSSIMRVRDWLQARA